MPCWELGLRRRKETTAHCVLTLHKMPQPQQGLTGPTCLVAVREISQTWPAAFLDKVDIAPIPIAPAYFERVDAKPASVSAVVGELDLQGHRLMMALA